MISGLIASFSAKVNDNPQISAAVRDQVGLRLQGDVSFVSTDQVRASAEQARIDPATAEALVSDYAEAQLLALKTGLLVAALLACAAFFATGSLPARAGPGRAAPRRPEPALVREPAGR